MRDLVLVACVGVRFRVKAGVSVSAGGLIVVSDMMHNCESTYFHWFGKSRARHRAVCSRVEPPVPFDNILDFPSGSGLSVIGVEGEYPYQRASEERGTYAKEQ